jgi:hypothetical protein
LSWWGRASCWTFSMGKTPLLWRLISISCWRRRCLSALPGWHVFFNDALGYAHCCDFAPYLWLVYDLVEAVEGEYRQEVPPLAKVLHLARDLGPLWRHRPAVNLALYKRKWIIYVMRKWNCTSTKVNIYNSFHIYILNYVIIYFRFWVVWYSPRSVIVHWEFL